MIIIFEFWTMSELFHLTVRNANCSKAILVKVSPHLHFSLNFKLQKLPGALMQTLVGGSIEQAEHDLWTSSICKTRWSICKAKQSDPIHTSYDTTITVHQIHQLMATHMKLENSHPRTPEHRTIKFHNREINHLGGFFELGDPESNLKFELRRNYQITNDYRRVHSMSTFRWTLIIIACPQCFCWNSSNLEVPSRKQNLELFESKVDLKIWGAQRSRLIRGLISKWATRKRMFKSILGSILSSSSSFGL